MSAFKSKRELRKILNRVLEELDADPKLGPKLRAAGLQQRFEISDLGLVLNIGPGDESVERLHWKFSDKIDWKPKLTMKMSADVANSYLQGKENIAIAIVRKRISTSCDARAALRYFPANRPILDRYSEIVAKDYPHLAI
ncbi:MAG: hypothetical protein QOJ38_1172 [Solirubrobacterales bacterium]|jgi:hypothetical protein|nr:hypothetical protein [Solirubrobacterales bacterium]